MPFSFVCPFCLHKTLVDDRMEGQSGACVECGKKITLPSRSTSKATSPIVESPPVVTRPAPSSGLSRIRGTFAFQTWMLKLVVFVIASVFLISVFSYNLWPSLVKLKARRDIVSCQQNLQRIANALNAYAAEYGCYPPPVTYDATGKIPMHSWRVLILPQLGYKQLYGRYNFKQAWNSPENSRLLPDMPREYMSPATDAPLTRDSTSYMLVTGRGTLFPSTGPMSPDSITDGRSQTLLVAETNDPQNQWTDPRDIDVTKLTKRIGKSAGTITSPNTIGGNHTGGATIVFADGTPAWIPDDTSPGIIQGLITPNGGEAIDGSWFTK